MNLNCLRITALALSLCAMSRAFSDEQQAGTTTGQTNNGRLAQQALLLEESVFKTRRAIRSGEAEVRVAKGRRNRHWKLWFKGDRLRMEKFDASGEVMCTTVHTPKQTFVRRISMKENGEAVVTTSVHEADPERGGENIFDLRKLGLYPLPVHSLHSIDDWLYFVANPKHRRISNGPATLEGHDVTEIVFLASDGDKTRVWIDEHRGPSIVRIEHTAHPKGRDVFVDSLAVDLAEIDGLWFPVQVVRQRKVGFRVYAPEAVVLENVRLNHEIDDSLFTLRSTGVEL